MNLEAEIKAFIDYSNSLYTTSVSVDINAYRAAYNRVCSHFTPPHPEGLHSRDSVINTPACAVLVRWYWRKAHNQAPCIVYFHGGGFVMGGLDSHDFICARLANDTGCKVVSVGYRLAPEHVFPAAFDDCYQVLCALQNAPEQYAIDVHRLIVCGDSAGGNLAAVVALANRDNGGVPLLGQIMIYPVVATEPTLPAYTECANAPMLSTRDIVFYRKIYLGGQCVPNTYSAPILSDYFGDLPPALLLPVEYDPLRDDAYLYQEKLQAAGVETRLHLGRGLVHGCMYAIDSSPGVQMMYRQILAFIHRHIDNSSV